MGPVDDIFFVPGWPVFYVDNHLLALYKPSGLLVQGDRTKDPSLMDLAKSWIKRRCAKPGAVFLGLVHRLDRPVAGVLLLCRTSKAARRVSEQFRESSTRKQYVAVVEGRIATASGTLTHSLVRMGSSSRVVSASLPESREARLSYEVLDTHGPRSLIKIELETGRHHQIRVQMAHVGCPILGDLRYGAPAPLPGRQIALLAQRLTIRHPTRNTPLTFVSPYPKGWPWQGTADPDAPPWNWEPLSQAVIPFLTRDGLPDT